MEILNQNPEILNKFRLSGNLTLKAVLIAVLTLFLLIPAAFISELVNERSERREKVETELSSKWASSQTLKGPVLVIPYVKETADDKGDKTYSTYYCTLLPENLDIDGEIIPEKNRSRGLFKAFSLYKSEINLKGEFPAIDFAALDIPLQDIKFERSKLCFGISDFAGLEDLVKVDLDGEIVELSKDKNDILGDNFSAGGMGVGIPLSKESFSSKRKFSMQLRLKGSDALSFAPMGKTMIVSLKSQWPNPSFFGKYLSSESEVSDSGFSVKWKLLDVNRNYPQIWKGTEYDLSEASFGVKMLNPNDSYGKTHRAVKYALLFIALTLGLCFCVEILQKRRIHPLQYSLIGLALCIFYTLLLSIGEYTGFNLAYLMASSATVALIAIYAASIFKSTKTGIIFGGVIAGLYSFIFILIQLSDGALLVGSVGLFILLCLIMYYTRKIDWYGER
ncbi:MAG: cell envelope integrity protein CreD [Prevotellaceae bacterium]|jgi:inner membrane protein|nr:cell envelope integrity protein CreD [Prevotellaceae bacterium]